MTKWLVVTILLANLTSCAPAKPTLSLQRAAEVGDLDQIEANFYHGAPVDEPDADGNTALGLACREGRLGVAQRLLAQGAEPGLADGNGRTPLQHAAGAGHEAVVRLLLERGVPPGQGLVAAVRAGHPELARLLIDKGADPNAPDAQGTRPLEVAGGQEMRALLIESGAEEDVLDMARSMLGHLDVVFGLLMEHPQDCDAAAAEVSRYVEQNREEIAGIAGRLQRAEKKLSEADRARFEEAVKAEAEGVRKKAMGPLMEFVKRCPEQMQALGEAMRTFAPR